MPDEIVADAKSGKLRGALNDHVMVFKGIPYAAAKRFMAPEKPAPWQGVRDALGYGPQCWQNENSFAMAPALREVFAPRDTQPSSEDCLVLNVWTPNLADGGGRPVMVWLHGGAFISGSGSSPWYDGTHLAKKGDVVVVTINHRLGAFGYMHLADLGGAEYAASGNAGMLDIVAALEWVRDNIAAFGGDPENVTIFGESGGGAKACVLMAMPTAKGLFHKAIVQSGPAVEMMSRNNATATAKQVMAELGVSDVAALKSVPAEKLLTAQNAVLSKINAMSFANRRRQGFNPTIDCKYLPGGPFTPEAPAVSANVPLLIGTNKDEMNLFFGLAPWTEGLTEDKMPDVARSFLGDRTDAILAAYRQAKPQASPRDLVLAAATDQSMRMPSLTIADRKLAQKSAAVFVYLFTWETPVLDGKLGSCHALEIPFVFDNLNASRLAGDGPTRLAIADRMSRAWIEFAYKDDPNNAELPHWPHYDSATRPTMIFDVQCRVENDPLGAERKAWN